VVDVEPGRFEEMAVTALDGLPEDLGRLMRNVAVTVEHDPGPPCLLGLYRGIPLTSRTPDYAGVLPDRITIYRPAICAVCQTGQEVADQVRRPSSMRSPAISVSTTACLQNSAVKLRPLMPEHALLPRCEHRAVSGLTDRIDPGRITCRVCLG
jgi:Zincin-like metallopeptidase